jgi:DNA-binding transcriptional ArsR family regulator
MDTEEQFGQVASLLGEPARAKMLWALLEGKAFTATELALRGEVSPQSASMHLGKLMQAGWLLVEQQGRHRYYQLASREVAYAIEAIANLLPPIGVGRSIKSGLPAGGSAGGSPAGGSAGGSPAGGSPAGSSAGGYPNGHIKYCRSCYDHMAGKAGVAVTEALLQRKLLAPAEQAYEVSKTGIQWFAALGIDTKALRDLRRSFARPCLDWSERRHHLSGSLGAALLEKMLADDWLRRVRHSRAMVITARGEKKFSQLLGLHI